MSIKENNEQLNVDLKNSISVHMGDNLLSINQVIDELGLVLNTPEERSEFKTVYDLCVSEIKERLG
jgi:hypothetical protein